ncbi:MAG: hypothetical protein WC860_02670 [Candidatus Margulisiibacteriota bacterium]|jgi:hypothetical protein
MSWNYEEIQDTFSQIRKKVVTDKEFRELFIKDPSAAILKLTGKQVPDDFNIKVIESDPNYHMTFVLPEMVSEKISVDDLASVDGGTVSALLIACVGAGACLAAVGDKGFCEQACVALATAG